MYLEIKNISVQRVNMQTSYLTLNSAFIMPAVLLTQALSHKTGLTVKGVSYVHHKFQPLMETFENVVRPQQRKAATFINKKDYSAKNKYALSSQPTASGHLMMSLILEVDDTEIDMKKVEYFFKCGRFAGGEIKSFNSIKILDSLTESNIKSGYYLIDRTDLMDKEDTLGSFISVLKSKVEKEKENEWLTPFVKGYLLLNRPKTTPGAREDIDVAFSEPALSIAQFKTIRSPIFDRKNDIFEGIPFWEMNFDSQNQIFQINNYFKQ